MYRVLYRKWRPQVFSDVVGQEHITETLTGAVMNGRVSHAYLFTGSRGTGKTTCAKILAKAVNCEHPVNGNPCNECAACKGIDDGSVVDVVEIDAASNNGVDNIRDLREETNYMPSSVKYRVYIIDEVHMLSTGAFNALLKTLEEPPEHVKFILATTEVHKLPATILSRCQRFDFKRIAPDVIAKRIKYVAEQEKIDLTDDGAMLISRIADGAMRDALSLLDRCSSYGKTITEEVASEAAGIAGREHIYSLVNAMTEHDCRTALNIVNELYCNSCDMERLFSELLSHFRNMMVTLTVPNYRELILSSESEANKIKAQAQKVTLETVLSCMDVINNAVADLKRGTDKRITAEMAIIKLTSPALCNDSGSVLRRISELERKIENGDFTKSAVNNTQTPKTEAPVKTQVPKPAPIEEKTADGSAEIDGIPFDVPPPPAEEFPEPAPIFDRQEIEKDTAPVSQQFVSEEPAVVNAPHKGSGNGGISEFPNWLEVLDYLREKDPLSQGFIHNSTAYADESSIYIKTDNAMFESQLNKGALKRSVETAVFEITGKNLTAKSYGSLKNEADEKPISEKSPLDLLFERAKGLDIQIIEQ